MNRHVHFTSLPLSFPPSFISSFPFVQAAQLVGAEYTQGQGHEFEAKGMSLMPT